MYLSRIVVIRFEVAVSWGLDLATTVMRPTVPLGFTMSGLTATMSGLSFSAASRLSIAALSDVE